METSDDEMAPIEPIKNTSDEVELSNILVVDENDDFSEIPKQVVKFSEYLDADVADFQFVNQFIKHLPYFNKIKENAFNELELIRTNLAKSILLNEIRPGLVHWTNRLQTFINEYGLFFSKSDHLRFIKIYLEIIATPEIDLVVIDLCFSILVELLKYSFIIH
jgi:hypothetical protein